MSNDLLRQLLDKLDKLDKLVGYLIYIPNKPKETSQTNYSEKPTTVVSQSPPTQRVVQSSPVQLTPQTLILVIPALKSQFLNELRNRDIVTNEDWENLYDATRYLCLVSPDKTKNQLSSIDQLDQFRVFQGGEKDSDIYFVHIELSQPDKGFKPNVNDNERFNAFRRLVNLPVTVSSRFRLEAYENLNVYNI